MNESQYKPRNYRIIRHVTKNRILDIQDALDIDKLRIELVEFAEGEGATLAVEHFAEPDALALICHDILEGRPWEKYVEFKGSVQGEAATSRVLVLERVEARNPVKITVSRGPGKVVGQGAIQPLGKPEATLSMLLSEFDARRIAFTILRHLAAYEAATIHARVAAGTRRPGSEAEDESEAPLPLCETAPVQTPEEPAAAPPAMTTRQAPQATEAQHEEAGAVVPPGRPAAAPIPPALAKVPAAQAASAAADSARSRRTPAVETYWMAAERLGVSHSEAEQILQQTAGDWGQAWAVLRRWPERERQAHTN